MPRSISRKAAFFLQEAQRKLLGRIADGTVRERPLLCFCADAIHETTPISSKKNIFNAAVPDRRCVSRHFV